MIELGHVSGDFGSEGRAERLAERFCVVDPAREKVGWHHDPRSRLDRGTELVEVRLVLTTDMR